MRIDSQLEVRHPYLGEVPAELMKGFQVWHIDPKWQWVAVHNGRVVAQLLSAPVHGMLYLMRLTALPEAPKTWAVKLFRQMLREGRELGMIGYMVMLEDSTPAQLQLMRIVQRHAGYLEPFTGVIAAGRLESTY